MPPWEKSGPITLLTPKSRKLFKEGYWSCRVTVKTSRLRGRRQKSSTVKVCDPLPRLREWRRWKQTSRSGKIGKRKSYFVWIGKAEKTAK